MPDSGAVYQPTTVGYTYDSGGDGTGGGGGGGGLRHGFSRIMSRHYKLSSRKWLEWTLLSVALCFFVAGLTTMLVSLVSADEPHASRVTTTEVKTEEQETTTTIDVQQHAKSTGNNPITIGAGMMLTGLLLGFVWTWLYFFRRSKSPRNGMTVNSSQYGPVLTEVPSQLKMKQTGSHDTPAVPLSDQEEETHTLMQEPAIPPAVSVGSAIIPTRIID